MHWKNREGFSLVELAIVLVIVGIMLAVGAPGLIKYFNAQSVHDGARTLSDEMRLARQKAVSNGTRNWVYTQFGAGANQYLTGVQTKNPNGTWSAIVWRGPIDLPGKIKQISADFNTLTYFYYDTNGRPNASGSLKVVSTLSSVTDTTQVNVDLSGSVW